MTLATRIVVAWMLRRHLAEILEIEQQSFEVAWNEEDFLRSLRQRHCVGVSALADDKVAGFLLYERYKSYVEVINFAVHPDWRRNGVGARLVKRLTDKRFPIRLMVRETNLAAQCFFRKQGFRAVRIVRAYYLDSGEDAFEMRWGA